MPHFDTVYLSNNKNTDQRAIKMHFNHKKKKKKLGEKDKEKNITIDYSRELEGTAALKHSYPAQLEKL